MGLILFTVLLYTGLQNTKLFADALRYLLGLVAPFITGGCIAFVANVPMRFFERTLFSRVRPRKGKQGNPARVCSLVFTIFAVVGAVAVVLFMVVPELYRSFAAIGRELTYAGERLPELFDRLTELLPMFAGEIDSFRASLLDVDWKAIGAVLLNFLQSGNILSNTVSLATSVVSTFANATIGIVFAIYILFQKENLGRQFRRLFYAFLPERYVDRWLSVCALTSTTFNSFLSGQCLEAVILALMFFVCMTIFQMPYALVIAVLIGITALIPVFGAFIGCIVGAFLILIVSPVQALWFLVLFFVLQQIEGNVIYPRVVGGSVGLPSIWVLTAVTLGASLGGVLGILFAIPVISVVYALLRSSVRARISERGIAKEKIR